MKNFTLKKLNWKLLGPMNVIIVAFIVIMKVSKRDYDFYVQYEIISYSLWLFSPKLTEFIQKNTHFCFYKEKGGILWPHRNVIRKKTQRGKV